MIAEGETGLLYPPGDVGALAEKLARVVEDRELRERVAVSARAWVSANVSREKSLKAVGELYDRHLRGALKG